MFWDEVMKSGMEGLGLGGCLWEHRFGCSLAVIQRNPV